MTAAGTNSVETANITEPIGVVHHLLTVTKEGTYSLKVTPNKPLKFVYQVGPSKTYNRIVVDFQSGSDYLVQGEHRGLGMLAANSNLQGNGQYFVTVPSFEVIPTEDTVSFNVETTKYGIAAMSGSGVKFHVFQ